MIFMLLQEKYNIKFILNEKMEFLFALFVILKKKRNVPIDWIEIPNISYVEEIINLIPLDDKLACFLENLKDSYCIHTLAISLQEDFTISNAQLKKELENYLSCGTIDDFLSCLKNTYQKINWQDFLLKHKALFMELFGILNLPPNFNIKDLQEFYGYSFENYYYIVSPLINGGFGHYNGQDIYCIRGFQYKEEQQRFDEDKNYLIENMFHEYSHAYINPLIHKYDSLFENKEQFLNTALKNHLPLVYKDEKTLLYEYFVRSIAKILAFPYTNEMDFSWITKHGFIYLEELTKYIKQKKANYKNFEELFVKELIPFINQL